MRLIFKLAAFLTGTVVLLILGIHVLVSFGKRFERNVMDIKECRLNKNDAAEFEYEDVFYTILEDTADRDDVGKWVGYIQRLAAVNGDGKVLCLNNIGDFDFSSLSELWDQTYLVPYLNVYKSDSDTTLYVDVKGEFHEAVMTKYLDGKDKKFDYKKTPPNTIK